MTQQDRTAVQYHKMTETPIPRLILSLAAPTILSMLITSIYNLADTFFVGRISTSASGAVGVVSSLMAIIQALGFMLGHGSGTIISRRLGSQDTHAATRFASTSFFTALAFGVVLAVVGLATLPDFMMLLGSTKTILPHACAYARPILLAAPLMISSLVMNNILRYEGKANLAMVGLVTGGLLNIALDPLFMFALGLGTAGAGGLARTVLVTPLGELLRFEPQRRQRLTGDGLGRALAREHQETGYGFGHGVVLGRQSCQQRHIRLLGLVQMRDWDRAKLRIDLRRVAVLTCDGLDQFAQRRCIP